MAAPNEVAAEIMEHLCSCEQHGYTQGNRWGDGSSEKLVIDGVAFFFAGGDRDCTSSIISAYESANVDCNGATFSGNMRDKMCSSGNFIWLEDMSNLKRGDILLNERNHAAMVVSTNPVKIAQFTISENNSIYGAQGDQTGTESEMRSWYDYPWDGILRFATVSSGGDFSVNDFTFPVVRYRVFTNRNGWLPELVNWTDSGPLGDSFAGNEGEPIIYLAIEMPGWYQVQTEIGGWLPAIRSYDVNDLVNGCAGDGTPITGIKCYYETKNPKATGWLKIEYQVSRVNADWEAPMRDLEIVSGMHSGKNSATPIDRFRARIIEA